MPHVPADLQKIMEAAAPTDVVWRYRPMFGGIGAYANDRMCVSLSDIGFGIKLAGVEHAACLALKGAKALQYEPSMPPSKTYVVLPGAMLKDRKLLGRWLSISAAQAVTVPAKTSRKAKPAIRGGKSRRT